MTPKLERLWPSATSANKAASCAARSCLSHGTQVLGIQNSTWGHKIIIRAVQDIYQLLCLAPMQHRCTILECSDLLYNEELPRQVW